MRLTKSGKKKYTVTMDAEKGEFVKEILNKSGMTLSGYLEASVIELYEMMHQGGMKDPGEMNAAELFEMLSRMIRRIQRDP